MAWMASGFMASEPSGRYCLDGAGLGHWYCFRFFGSVYYVEKNYFLGVIGLDDDFNRTLRGTSFKALILGVVLAVAALTFGRLPQALGVMVGCFFALVNFHLLARSVVRVTEHSNPNRARGQAAVSFFARYLLTVLFLTMVLLNHDFDFLAAVVGLLTVKIVILGGAVIGFVRQQATETFASDSRKEVE